MNYSTRPSILTSITLPEDVPTEWILVVHDRKGTTLASNRTGMEVPRARVVFLDHWSSIPRPTGPASEPQSGKID